MILEFFGECVGLKRGERPCDVYIYNMCKLCPGLHISTEVSLGVVAASLSSGVLLSLMNKSSE